MNTTDVKTGNEKDFQRCLKAYKTIAVAHSGDVLLNKLEIDIINTPTFQRLRKVKQLGSTFLVYPSAIHTRFEHSLGAVKHADEIIKGIGNNLHNIKDEEDIDPTKKEEQRYIDPIEEQLIRLLALLHDIGHMPYGHTIEDEFGIFKSHDQHAARWQYFLGENSDIGKLIKASDIGKYHDRRGDSFYVLFYKLITCDKKFDDLNEYAFLYDIVSDTICADLLDYLNRDCAHTNLKLNHHPRFLNYFFIARKDSKKRIALRVYKSKQRGVRKDIISELIQLLRNRYYLGERVYYHHAKIKTGTLIAGAVLRAKEAGAFKPIENVDQNPIENGENSCVYNIHAMGDDELLLYLLKLKKEDLTNYSDSSKAKELMNDAIRLAEAFDKRLIYKEIFSISYGDLQVPMTDSEKIINNDFKDIKNVKLKKIEERFLSANASQNRLNAENDIAKYLGWKSGDILFYCPSYKMSMKLANVLITADNDDNQIIELRNFHDNSVSNVIDECKSILLKHQALWAARVFVNPEKYNEFDLIPESDKNDLINLRKIAITSFFKYQMGFEEESFFWENYLKLLINWLIIGRRLTFNSLRPNEERDLIDLLKKDRDCGDLQYFIKIIEDYEPLKKNKQ